MSATPSLDVDRAVEECRPEDVTPVALEASALESTAPEYLRDLKRTLAEEGLAPTSLSVEACFDTECSLATQDEADRLRGFVRAASFLGVAVLRITVDDVADEERVHPALSACAERARREGVRVDVEGPISLE